MKYASDFRTRVADMALKLSPVAAGDWLVSHGLVSLADEPRLAAATRARLREERHRNVAANLQRIDEFRRLRQATEGLPICPLKGIFLLDRIYAEAPGDRYLRDLDILVPLAGEAAILDRLAADLGPTAGVATDADDRHLFAHDRPLRGRGALLDIHTRLGFQHGPRSGWEDLAPQPGTVHGCQVFCLDRETTLVHLVTHFVRHGPLARLAWVEDILRWIDRGVDLEESCAVAARLGAARSYRAGLERLRRLTGIDLPPRFDLQGVTVSDSWLHRLDLQLWPALRREDPLPPKAANRLQRNLSALLLVDRPSDAARLVKVKAREVWERRRVRGAR